MLVLGSVWNYDGVFSRLQAADCLQCRKTPIYFLTDPSNEMHNNNLVSGTARDVWRRSSETTGCAVQYCRVQKALWDTETPILIQKRHPYTGNLNSETPGDS